jgi:hypothetical protein
VVGLDQAAGAFKQRVEVRILGEVAETGLEGPHALHEQGRVGRVDAGRLIHHQAQHVGTGPRGSNEKQLHSSTPYNA